MERLLMLQTVQLAVAQADSTKRLCLVQVVDASALESETQQQMAVLEVGQLWLLLSCVVGPLQ